MRSVTTGPQIRNPSGGPVDSRSQLDTVLHRNADCGSRPGIEDARAVVRRQTGRHRLDSRPNRQQRRLDSRPGTGLARQHHPQRRIVIKAVEPLALCNARFGIRFRHIWVRSPAILHPEHCVAPVLMYCA